MKSEGKYIVIEGHDGTGKSTQVGLIREKLKQKGIESIEFHEPEGTPIADAIRTVIKNGTLERDAMTNLLLFSAARHELWTKCALPALASGKWVVASRNYFSTLAYQGRAENLGLEPVEQITRIATDEKYMKPDVAFILSLEDEAERKRRISTRGGLENPDTFESRDDDFQALIQNAYKDIAIERNLQIIDASQPIENITKQIWEAIW